MGCDHTQEVWGIRGGKQNKTTMCIHFFFSNFSSYLTFFVLYCNRTCKIFQEVALFCVVLQNFLLFSEKKQTLFEATTSSFMMTYFWCGCVSSSILRGPMWTNCDHHLNNPVTCQQYLPVGAKYCVLLSVFWSRKLIKCLLSAFLLDLWPQESCVWFISNLFNLTTLTSMISHTGENLLSFPVISQWNHERATNTQVFEKIKLVK